MINENYMAKLKVTVRKEYGNVWRSFVDDADAERWSKMTRGKLVITEDDYDTLKAWGIVFEE